MTYSNLRFEIKEHVAEVILNQPEKANAMNQTAWKELKRVFESCEADDNIHVVILSGEGKHFCSGIDLALLRSVNADAEGSCPALVREGLRKFIGKLQASISRIEECSKPVLSAIHGGCIGAGLDIVAASDMRFCTMDSFFTIKEIDMAMVADLGSLQRLPKIIPEGIVRELAFTGRNFVAQEARNAGLVNEVFDDRQKMLDGVREIASTIAKKSPLALRGTKAVLNHARDNTTRQGLEFVATWNAGMLISEDLKEALQAFKEKRPPSFKSRKNQN